MVLHVHLTLVIKVIQYKGIDEMHINLKKDVPPIKN